MAKKEIPITIEMPKKLLRKWLKALRSGKYKQGKGKLYGEGRYCCLGVLQKVADGETEQGKAMPSINWLKEHGVSFSKQCGLVGLSPFLPTLGFEAHIANDGNKIHSIPKRKFTTIANAIEKCAKGV